MKVVVLKKTNAFVRPTLLPLIAWLRPDCVVNPNLFSMKEVPTYFWKKKDGKIVEMTRPEKIKRLKDIERFGEQTRDLVGWFFIALLIGCTVTAGVWYVQGW